MKVFEIAPAGGHELVHPVFENDFEYFITQINGARRRETWSPIPVKLVRDCPVEGQLREADVPWHGSHVLVLKRRAAELLGPFLRDYGELLPLDCADAQMVVFNPTTILDALDEAGSKVSRFKDGRIMLIDRYAFRSEILNDADIFKIRDSRISPIFFSEGAVKIWKKSKVTGIDFKQVWEDGK